eukprot:s31_g16.t1
MVIRLEIVSQWARTLQLGQELFNGPLAKSTTVGRLKEELLLLLLIPRAEQELTCGQLVKDDDITLQALFDLKQEETELYGMLQVAVHPATRRSSQSPQLDFTLFLRSGFYFLDVAKTKKCTSPGLRVAKRSSSLAQRIFVEEVMPGWSTTIQPGDELIEVNHRKVASLASVEFARLFGTTQRAQCSFTEVAWRCTSERPKARSSLRATLESSVSS